MEIRQIVRGGAAGFTPARPAKRGETGETGAVRPSADRVELSRQWVEQMEEQRAQSEAALLGGGKEKDKDNGGLLGYMETAQDNVDAVSEALDIQMKCMKIAMNIMKGRKVPPQDEQYLMEHDPDAYKLAMSMKTMVKEDDKECKSVLDDEDKDGKTAETGETAPPDGGETAPAEASSGEGGETAE